MNDIITQLKKRDLITKITNEHLLVNELSNKSISLYCGFDPTSDSLHLGHLIPLLCLKRFQLSGHQPIVLIGGATGLIGDPSFKSRERKLNSLQSVEGWVNNIKQQISFILECNYGKNKAIILNNFSWFNSMNILTFLRKIGKYFSINQMLNKEAIRKRLNRNNTGISFTEFTYALMQSYDFAYLNKQYNVRLQIGGSDQWGNIISGISLTRRMYENIVYGLTLPLITKSDGTKFGKTETESIWLDPNKTSPYKFFQFWINTDDKDVYTLLKYFTFIDIHHLSYLKKKNNLDIILKAKYLLAEEITRIVHGTNGLIAAKRITDSLFHGTLQNLKFNDVQQLIQDGIPKIVLNTGTNLPQALVIAGLASSLRQARQMISANAISINGNKQILTNYIFSNIDRIYDKYTILSRGKKNHYIIIWK